MTKGPSEEPLLIAHRGAPGRGAFENTLRAFRAAADAGADGVELDVRTTKDGRLVVFHDAQAVPRSGGKALPVSSLTLDDLRNPSLEVHDRVTSLEETLRALLGRTGALVEMKDPGIEERVVAAVRSLKADTRLKWLIVASFRPESVRAVLRAAPEIRTALIVGRRGPGLAGTMRGWRPLAAWKASGAHDLCVEHSLVTPALVKGVTSGEGRVFPWTVNEPADLRRVLAAGCAGVITDDVAMAADCMSD